MNRRNFLRIAGGGVILAAGGASAWIANSTPAKALAPWAMAGGANYADPRMNALSYAILAPNPHNRQPWIIDLVGSDQITLRFDIDRQLPHTDPMDRQLTIGLGCFLELMTMAATANGYAVDMDLFPEGEDDAALDTRPIAHARFRPAEVKPDPLWAYVPDRRSNKEPYDTTRAVLPDQLDRILDVAKNPGWVGGSVTPEDVTFWRKLTTDALMLEIETPRTYKESVDLFRIGKREVTANPDGIDFSGPLFETLHLTGMMTRDATLDRTSMAYNSGLDAVLSNTESAMGHVWMVTPGNTRRDQIAAGGEWLRLNLGCTREGLGFQPLSQALQEYPEMDAHYAEVHTRLAPNGGTVQMLARIGYGPDVAVSPRWPLEAKLGRT
ncbi:MAG: twin-arginine translocation pathway signal protein [Pseudomonadota bacterium]